MRMSRKVKKMMLLLLLVKSPLHKWRGMTWAMPN